MKQMDGRLPILTRLRATRAVRAADLAEDCGCSVRTVYRDIDALFHAGIPIAALAGEGYRLVPGYHLPPIAFTADEASQLLLGTDLALGLGTTAQRDAAAAAAKVEAALGVETEREVERRRERVQVAAERREPSPWLPVVLQAVLEIGSCVCVTTPSPPASRRSPKSSPINWSSTATTGISWPTAACATPCGTSASRASTKPC